MNSQINQTMIEGLLSIGLGRKPEVHWEPFRNELEPVLQALADHRVALPQLRGNETESHLLSRTGLGLLTTNVADAQDYAAAWPVGGMQRIATVAMELGAVAAKVVTNFFFCERYVQSFVEELEFDLLVARCEGENRGEWQESPMNLVFLMSMHHALMRANLAESDLSRTVNGVLDTYRAHDPIHHLFRTLDAALADCAGTEDYAALACVLFPDASDSNDTSSDEQSSGECNQTQDGGSNQPDLNEQGAKQPTDQDLGSSDSGHQAFTEGGAGCCSISSGDAASADLQEGLEQQEVNGQSRDMPSSNSLGLTTDGEAPFASVVESDGDVPCVFMIPEDGPLTDQSQSTTLCCIGGDALMAERVEPIQSEKVSDSRLVATLLRVFQEKKPKSNGYVTAGPRVASHRMWRLKRLGDVAVFRKPVARCGIDISVQILLDTSGSMSRDLQCASNVTIALAEAMARTSGAKCALSVFPASGAYTQDILGFGGQVASARREIRRIHACGGTPMGEAMAEVIPRLGRERSLRKLLLVITDGSPGNSSKVRDQVSVADSLGIEGLCCTKPVR